MANCPDCGAEIKEGYKFCLSCGEQLKEAAAHLGQYFDIISPLLQIVIIFTL